VGLGGASFWSPEVFGYLLGTFSHRHQVSPNPQPRLKTRTNLFFVCEHFFFEVPIFSEHGYFFSSFLLPQEGCGQELLSSACFSGPPSPIPPSFRLYNNLVLFFSCPTSHLFWAAEFLPSALAGLLFARLNWTGCDNRNSSHPLKCR